MPIKDNPLTQLKSSGLFKLLLRWGYRHMPIPIGVKRDIWRKIQILKIKGKSNINLTKRTDQDQITNQTIGELKDLASDLRFATSEQSIEISIIIPCYDQLAYTINCLRSLAEHKINAYFEIIVINDASPNDDYSILRSIPGLTLINNAVNLGYLESCNKACSLAKGRYLYLLNNDTYVTAGSVDALHQTFSHFPKAGLVGSKLFYPSGILQEAGGIVWNDGSAWNFGRFEISNEPRFNYLRSVDYCSAASVMIPRDLFDKLGGFDPIYKPAYYEDTDLALRIRHSGWDVLYQPQSNIIHYEGVSHGIDPSQGLKKHQLINQKTFQHRWSKKLSNHQNNGVNPDQEKDRNFKHKVLLIDKCTPSPNQDAGSVVLINLMLMLRHLGFQPTFIPDDNYAYLEPYTPFCQSLGVECLYAPYVTNVAQHVKQQGDRYDLVILFRPDLTQCHLKTIRKHCSKAQIIYYPHDLHFIRLEREGQLLKKKNLIQLARKSRIAELQNSSKADSTIVVSTSEQMELQRCLPEARIDFLPLIFSDQDKSKLLPHFGSLNMVFVGSFNHSPNADAVQWFVSDVMPLITEKLPEAQLHVVGSNTPAKITRLASSSVIIHGFVEDLDTFFSSMSLSVVPLRFGAGMKGKVGSALRCGLPVVSTSIGCEGTNIQPEEGVLIADNPTTFSAAVIKALTCEQTWHSLSNKGMSACKRLWGKEVTVKRLESILKDLGLNAEPTHAHEDLKIYPF